MEKRRFAFYAEFVNLEQRQTKPKLIIRSRELLEQALAQCIEPKLESDDMHLEVLGEAAIIYSTKLDPLLAPVADLFARFVDMSTSVNEPDLRLWLRAGVSVGAALEVDRLVNGRRIRTLPFLDTSLAQARELKSLRKGSRIFIYPGVANSIVARHPKVLRRWNNVTGHGELMADVVEYHWPSMAYSSQEGLIKITRKLYELWTYTLSQREWDKREYFDRALDLDETLKLLIRTVSMSCSRETKRALFLSILPNGEAVHTNARYEWGVWFQVLRGLVDGCEPGTQATAEVASALRPVWQILEKDDLLQNFLSELSFPDYASFRADFQRLSLYPDS